MASVALGRRALRHLINLRDFQRSLGSGPLQRDSRFSQLTDSDLKYFRDVVGDSGVIADPHDLQMFNRYAQQSAKNRKITTLLFTLSR